MVNVFCLTRDTISLLSENIQTEIHSQVVRDLFKDLDRPFASILELEERVKNQQQWEIYKHQLRKLLCL